MGGHNEVAIHRDVRYVLVIVEADDLCLLVLRQEPKQEGYSVLGLVNRDEDVIQITREGEGMNHHDQFHGSVATQSRQLRGRAGSLS